MNAGLITMGNLEPFRSLLLPEAVAALESNRLLTTLGLSEKDTPIGALSGCLREGRFEILSLYVDPEYRGRGGGRRLLDELMGTLRGYATEVSVTIPGEDLGTLGPFLNRCGFFSAPAGDRDRITYLRPVA